MVRHIISAHARFPREMGTGRVVGTLNLMVARTLYLLLEYTRKKIATARKKDYEEEESESVEQGPWKPLKKRRCGWLDVEQDIARERRTETAQQREVQLALLVMC